MTPSPLEAPGEHTATLGALPGVERALARHRRKYEAEIERLVAATFRVMRKRDTAEPTVNDILDEAGLSTSAFYRHFPTKDDLLVTLLRRAHELTRTHVDERIAATANPRQRIEEWVRAMFDLVRTDELMTTNRPFLLAHPRLLERYPLQINAGFESLLAPLIDAIAAARVAAGLPAGDPATDARLVLHQVFGMLVDAAALRTPPAPASIDAVISYTLRAVLAPVTRKKG